MHIIIMIIITIIRPYAYVITDQLLQMSHVAWSVYLSACYSHWCTAQKRLSRAIRHLKADSWTKEPRIRWVQIPVWEEAIFGGLSGPFKSIGTFAVAYTAMAELIEMPFWGLTRRGPKELYIRWESRSRTGRGNLWGCPARSKALTFSAALYAAKRIIQSPIMAWHAMRPFVKILWWLAIIIIINNSIIPIMFSSGTRPTWRSVKEKLRVCMSVCLLQLCVTASMAA